MFRLMCWILSDVMEVKGGRPWSLFWIKLQLLVKDNTQVSYSGARGQGNAIQINYVVG